MPDATDTVAQGADALQKLARLVAAYPGEFELDFHYDGQVPLIDSHRRDDVYGVAEVFPLYQGKPVWQRNSTIRYPFVTIDLGNGTVVYNDGPYIGWDDLRYGRKIAKARGGWAGTGSLGMDAIPMEQFEKLWTSSVRRVKHALAAL